MRKRSAFVCVSALAMMVASAQANLIPIGVVPSTGNGLGAVLSSVTFQNTGTESGCVAYNGAAAFTGASACSTGFIGGDETTGSGNNIYSTTQLGFSATRNFSNLVLIFNGNEGGGADAGITVNRIGLSLFSSTGTRLATFTSASPDVYSSLPGIGNAGLGYALDATQAAQANAFLTSGAVLYLGTEANASSSCCGPETIQLSTVSSTGGGGGGGGGGTTPEPGTWILFGSGLILTARTTLKRRRAS